MSDPDRARTGGDGKPHVVCLLAEGSYFHGAAAMANSLVRNGFVGHIVAGYRGALPHWDGPVQPRPGSAQEIAPGADITFVPVEGTWHLSNLKPQFMRRVAAELFPGLASLWYFDCDIVLKTAWEAFPRWVADGMLLFLDMAETYMPANHAFRLEWQDLAQRAGLGFRPTSGYVNGGCIGLAAGHLGFLDAWAALLDAHAAAGTDMTRMINRSGKPEYAKMDQDLLNAAVQATDTPYRVLGQEAMGVWPWADILAHAMVGSKPWTRRYIREAMIGFQADDPHRAYWHYASGPIRTFSDSEWRRKMRTLKAARLIGHVRRRSMRDW